ncbi:MAG: UDP-N-acetylmuramyl pentapeptide phosphotransferase [Desulfobacteraceae bacterium]|nr:UDP-N-acetylmuramyl pentapeptide phosphotransferase [Desulfobacteraceae bacterium]
MSCNFLFILLSFFFGTIGAWVIYKYGAKLGLVDIPNARSSHSEIIPRGGGIGILIAFVFFSLYFFIDLFLWVPALILSSVSFFGDKYQISPKLRLYVQSICSLVFLIGLFYSRQVDPLSYILIFPISIFMVGTANFYNFMDGINGISGLTAIVAFVFAGYYGFISGFDDKYVLLCGVITFSCIGFLPFNFPEARVFMGDVGSILLGFVFSCIVLLFSQSVTDFIIVCSFLCPFYIDELSTIIVRINAKDKLINPHRKHLYQLLANELKVSHGKVSLIYALIQIVICASVLIVRHNIYFVILFIICYSFLFCIWSYIIRKKVGTLLSTR